jgi:predicted DNA-binding transcriptional regulator AlpA
MPSGRSGLPDTLDNPVRDDRVEGFRGSYTNRKCMSQLITETAILAKLGCSRSTLINWRKSGKFPPPLKLSARMIRWPEKVVDDWIEALGKDGTV